LVKATASIRSQVIEKHLYGHSLSQIAKEIGISKTNSYNIVQDWNSRVSSLNIDDIRIFLSNIGKSGITIEEYVQGYRTAQIFKAIWCRR
jgi:orotate phosphoribosyltransferase-like protein